MPQPIGVCIVVFNKDNHILLGKRLNSYKSGSYGLPGGRVEIKEKLIDAVHRELAEETGLKTHSLEYVGVVRELQEGYNFIHFIFTCRDYKGEPKALEPTKCESWDWYLPNTLPQDILPGHMAGIEMLVNPSESKIRDLL